MYRFNANLYSVPIVALTIFSLVSGAWASEEENSLSLYPSTHQGWATSLESGNIDGEIWVSHRGLLDGQELLRQLDFDGEIRVLESDDEESHRPEWVKGLKKLDLLVCSDVAWDFLTLDEQEAVHGRIQAGMGLVLIALDRSRAIDNVIQGWEEAALPAFLQSDYSMPMRDGVDHQTGAWKVFKAEEGRIALFQGDYRPLSQELVPFDRVDGVSPSLLYEYHLGKLIRAMLWAGQQEIELRIAGITRAALNEPDVRQIPPQLPTEFTQYMLDGRMKTATQTVGLQLATPARRNYDVFVRVRQPYRASDSSWSYRAENGIRKGEREVIVHVPVGKGESWVDLWVTRGDAIVDWVSYGITLEEWPSLSDVSFSKRIVQPSDSVEVIIRVEANSYKPKPTYAFYVVSDSYNRVLSEQRVEIGSEGGDVKTLVHWTDALSTSMTLEVYLTDSNMAYLSDWSRKYASYAKTKLIVEQPRATGVQWIADGVSVIEPWVSAGNSALSSLGVNTIDVGEAAYEGQGGVEANLSSVSHLDVFSTRTSADEVCLTSPEFQEHLYETLQHWGGWARVRNTDFLLFDAILDSEAVCDSKSCRLFRQQELRSYYPSLDRLNTNWGTDFSSWDEVIVPPDASRTTSVVVDTLRMQNVKRLESYTDLEKQLSRLGITAKAGIQSIEHGMSSTLSELVPELAALSISPEDLLMDKVRSYKATDAFAGVRLDDQDISVSKSGLWNAMFRGMTGVWSGGLDSAGRVDGTVRVLGEEIYTLRQGIDVLLQSSRRQTALIAIYENSASTYVSTPEERIRRGQSQEAVVQALEALGLGYGFVSYSALMETGFSDYTVVILPAVTALSDEEEALFDQFANQGGTLIADGVPGQVDEHGIKRESFNAVADAAISISFSDVDAGRTKLDEAAQEMGIPRLYPETSRVSQMESSPKWFRYQYGQADLIAVLSAESDLPAMRFPEGSAVYDMLSGTLLKTGKARASLNDSDAGLITVLPYRVSRILVDTPGIVQSGHRLRYAVQIKTFDALPGDHLVHVRLLDERGNSIRYYEANVECVAGFGEGYLPLSLNERPGNYTLEVRDVMTGITALRKIEVI